MLIKKELHTLNSVVLLKKDISASINLFKVNNGNARAKREICPKLTIKIPGSRIGIVVVSLLLTSKRFHILLWCFHRPLGISKCQLGGQIKVLTELLILLPV